MFLSFYGCLLRFVFDVRTAAALKEVAELSRSIESVDINRPDPQMTSPECSVPEYDECGSRTSSGFRFPPGNLKEQR